jgi:thiamine-phosphate pyrophosphorylase
MGRGIFPRVVLVTDPVFGDDRIAWCLGLVARVLPRGWLCVQLRDKRRPLVSLRVFASRLRLVTRNVGASLVINGDARLARDVGADGVHLGRGAGTVTAARSLCGPRAWVSVAAHSDDAVRAAVESGADAVLVSPVFSTRAPTSVPRSGASGQPKEGRGIGALRSARSVGSERVALYALGGVTAENAGVCMAAGADGIAVMRALLAAAEPGRAARALHDAIAARC